MSVVTCGVTLSEVLVAIGDSYWRCVSCHLRFPKLTSIDEHVRQKHEQRDEKSCFTSVNPIPLASNPKLDSAVCTVSLEDDVVNSLSPVPAVFKINLDNPGSEKRPNMGSDSDGANVQNSCSPTVSPKSSTELVPSKCQTMFEKIEKIGHLNNSNVENMSPFSSESTVTSDINNDVNHKALPISGSQSEQQDDCEDMEGFDGDENVSKAMLASMLSLLEKGLEMDDISNVFQNWDSVSPEFFEQQLLNHCDLSDYPPDSIDDTCTLGDFSKEDHNSSKDAPIHVQSPSCINQTGKVSGACSLKETEQKNDNRIHLEVSSANQVGNISLVGESRDYNVGYKSSTSAVYEKTSSEFYTMGFSDSVNRETVPEFEGENIVSEEHQTETSASRLTVKNLMKFPTKQSKIYDLMSSLLLKETQTDSSEDAAYCDSKLRNNIEVGHLRSKKSDGNSDTTESSVYENRGPNISSISSSILLPSQSAGDEVPNTKPSLHYDAKRGYLPTKNSRMCSDHFKKSKSQTGFRFKQTTNSSSSQLSSCLDHCHPLKSSSFTENSGKPQTSNAVVIPKIVNKSYEITVGGTSETTISHREKTDALKIFGTCLPSSSDQSILKHMEDRTNDNLCDTTERSPKLHGPVAAELNQKAGMEIANHEMYDDKSKKNKSRIVKSLMKVVSTDLAPSPNMNQTQSKNSRSCHRTPNKTAALMSIQEGYILKKAKIDTKDSQEAVNWLTVPSSDAKVAQGSSTRTSLGTSPSELMCNASVMPNQESKTKYICTICDASFSSSGALQRHMKVNFASTKPCECKICHQKFHCLSLLSVHLYKCHEGLGTPKCLMCYAKCSSMKYLLQHVRKHQKTAAEKVRRRQQQLSSSSRESIKSKHWRCGKCNLILLNRKQVIKAHVCVVSKTCKQCNMEFHSVSSFKLHMASHQGLMFECNICGEFFKNTTSRDRHRLTHKGNFLCQICGRQFAHQHLLTKHLKIHTQVRKASPPLTCVECNKVYKCKRSFQRHINVVHLGMDYQFKCFYCQHQFLTSNQLREHVAWQHFGEKPHHCRYCDKTFVCRPTMIRHERNEHTGSKPYKCRFCPEAFVEKKLLDIHEAKQHTLVFPYKCDVCGKGFVQRSYLRSHMLTHMNHKPHQCDICGSCFSKPCHLKRHTVTCLKKRCNTTKKTSMNINSDAPFLSPQNSSYAVSLLTKYPP